MDSERNAFQLIGINYTDHLLCSTQLVKVHRHSDVVITQGSQMKDKMISTACEPVNNSSIFTKSSPIHNQPLLALCGRTLWWPLMLPHTLDKSPWSATHLTKKIFIKILISFFSDANSYELITTNFCTCHDSLAVMACAKICCDLITWKWYTTKWNCHHIQIVSKK